MRIHCALIAAGLAASFPVNAAVNGINAGGPLMKLEAGQAATRAGAFLDNFYQPGGTSGQVISNVNLFTGQPSYTIPLHVLNARGQVAFPLNLTFSGPVFPTVENNNDRAPSGWIGLGWSLSVPFVAVNHKGTFTYADDVVMCNLGPYGGGQILREPKTGRYFVSSAPGIRVEFDTVGNAGSPLFRQIKEWRFILPDGTRLLFGGSGDSVANSHRYAQSNKGLIIASPYNTGSTKPFLYRWDLRRMEDDSRKTGIDFEYERFQESLWGGKSYTRESYLRKAIWRDEFGNEVERVELGLETLESGESFGYFPNESKSSQKLFETRRLKDVSVYHEGRRHVKYVLQKDVRSTDYGKKRLLGGIHTFFTGADKAGPGWEFTYRADAPRKFLLEEIRLPSGGKEKYEYNWASVGSLASQQPASVFRDKNGQPVVPSGATGNWVVEAQCDDRFCYELVRSTTPNPDRVWVRVTHNSGNYFDTAVAYQETLQASGAASVDWTVIPMGNHFLIANAKGGTVDLMEWRGKKFEPIDTLFPASDPLRAGFGGEIEIHPAGNYFVVYRRTTSVRRTWVYMKDPSSGAWRNMTHGGTATYPGGTCKLHNPAIGKNVLGWLLNVRAPGDSCMVWDSTLVVSANPRMLAVGTHRYNVLYLYALKADGSGFDLVSDKLQFIDTSTQISLLGVPISQVRWKREIREIQTPGDLLVIKDHVQPGGSGQQSYTRYYMMLYDGDTIKNVGRLVAERDDGNNTPNLGNRWDRHLLFGPGYFIHANTEQGGTTNRRIEYWRRMQNADSVYFQLAKTLRTDPPDESGADLRIALSPRFVSVEYYPNGSFTQGDFPLNYPLVASGKYRSWIYRIADNGGIDSLDESLYSHSWGGGCTTRLWNKSFSNLDQTMLAMTSRGTGGACVCTASCIAEEFSARLNFHQANVAKSYLFPPVNGEFYFRNTAMAVADRLAAGIRIRKTGTVLESIHTQKYYFNGTDYDNPLSATVSKFIRETVPGDPHPPLVTEFQFGGQDIREFNHNFLAPQFEYAKIVHKGLPGGTEYTQYVDYMDQKLQQDSAGLSGRVRCITTVNGAGDTIAVQHTAFDDPYSRGWAGFGARDTSIHDPWPRGVAVNRAERTAVRQWADNRSKQTHRTFYHAYTDTLEAPLFTVTEQGDRRAVTQSILGADGLRVKRALAYDYPDTATLIEAFLQGYRTTPLPINAAQGKYAVASSEVEYDPVFKYKVNQTMGWRDPGGSWDDEELKAGPTPAFDPSQNTFVASEISRRDSLGQPLESFIEDGENNRKYTSVFYEGRAALPVGAVTGARRDNIAVLTAENGGVPQLLALGKLDRDKVWDAHGVTYDSVKVRTGRYSFKVTDNFGPSGNLHLKDVAAGGFGFIASAWIFGDMDDEPIFSVSRRHADNSQQNEVRGAPVEGSYQRGKWQRWEAHLSRETLTANGMFADESGDYLRFFIGSGSPSSTPSKVLYVDDVVLRPDNAVFSLSAYNERGQPTHTTDTHHRTFTHEYGFAGQPAATRDERGRIFGQGGFNKPGENLP